TLTDGPKMADGGAGGRKALKGSLGLTTLDGAVSLATLSLNHSGGNPKATGAGLAPSTLTALWALEGGNATLSSGKAAEWLTGVHPRHKAIDGVFSELFPSF